MKTTHAVIGLVVVAIWASAPAGADALARFEKAWASEDPRVKLRAVRGLGQASGAAVARRLIGLLAHRARGMDPAWPARRAALDGRLRELKDQRVEDASGKLVLTAEDLAEQGRLKAEIARVEGRIEAAGRIVPEVVTALARLSDAEARRLLLRAVRPPTPWVIRVGLVTALGRSGHPDARATVRRLVADADPRVAITAITAIREGNDQEGLPAVRSALRSRYWQVRSSAAAALAAERDLGAVGPLVRAYAGARGRLRDDFEEALERITGQELGEPGAWKRWYEGCKQDLARAVGMRRMRARRQGTGRSVTFYGIRTRSENVCFVLDRSGSMAFPAGWGQAGGMGSKLDVARDQLLRALGALPRRAGFNIVHYSTGVKRYHTAGPLVRATAANKRIARAWALNKLRARGLTNLHDAMREALDLASPAARKRGGGIDTIFLLSDGSPTAGPVQAPARILEALTRINLLRQVKIHCVAVGGANSWFLRELATRNGGTFVHVK